MVKKKTEAKEKEDLVLLFIGYIFWLVALILYVVKKDELSGFSKYHYIQAVAIGLIGFVFSIVTFGIGGLLVWLYSVYIGYQVYSGKDPRPLEKYISKYAE
ncbi:hypothetical protein [Caldisericum sp.]|uniref:hypothetical protein n=1 Tax=Caldisericum sp. TaxID=2499687 RepID=UPI003D0DC7EA